MAVIPQPNVPEQAMPWAREITKRVLGATEVGTREAQRLDNAVVQVAQVSAAAYAVASDVVANKIAADASTQLINDELALPLTDAKLLASTLTVWPFVNQTIPGNAFEPGAVGAADIADFAISSIKLNDNRHHIF